MYDFAEADQIELEFYEEMDWQNIVTPIRVHRFAELLTETGYDKDLTQYLIDGFTKGFDIGYHGPLNRKNVSDNIPIKRGLDHIPKCGIRL